MGLRFGQSTRNIFMVHHCYRHYLVAGPDTLCRWRTHPMRIRYPNVDVCISTGRHLCLLYHARRPEGCGKAYTNVYQMVLLIIVSLILVLVGLDKVGGVSNLVTRHLLTIG